MLCSNQNLQPFYESQYSPYTCIEYHEYVVINVARNGLRALPRYVYRAIFDVLYTRVRRKRPFTNCDIRRMQAKARKSQQKQGKTSKKQRFRAFYCISFVFLLCFPPKRGIKKVYYIFFLNNVLCEGHLNTTRVCFWKKWVCDTVYQSKRVFFSKIDFLKSPCWFSNEMYKSHANYGHRTDGGRCVCANYSGGNWVTMGD